MDWTCQMRKLDLWPTTVYQFELDKSYCKFLKTVIATNSAMELPPEDMIPSGVFDAVVDCISTVGHATIVDAWVRTAEIDVPNNFEIHCDSHKGTDYIGVLWLTGDNDMGGDLVLYDPAWRNPQRLRHDDNQTCNLKQHFKFEVGTLTLFPADVWHEVTRYNGQSERISLNFAIDIN